MCLAQGPQRSDAGEALTRGPSVSSQALYHRATALTNSTFCIVTYWAIIFAHVPSKDNKIAWVKKGKTVFL